ncbi:hypothetical protein BUALT_Bualt10G0060100 [Buddleja alternifolia]|uniref:Glycosyltransferase N-terminal domain-containing protein n=1 Tax=Buddleja alternifolia TaxID=168488 RepID=A0AAV6X771_9LAMI|nr:hypothetical protein BUALT_Bualt10G0060100 [Buddleja alternifolia]
MVVIKGKKPHVLAVPLPFQGHVKPLMKLCRQIAKHGIKVTFVNIQSVHEKLLAAAKMSDEDEELGNIVLTSIPDGRSPEDVDENDSVKLLEALRITMPGYLTELIERINSSNDDEKISCVITDITMGWILETAEKMGAEPVAFSPPSAAVVAIALHIPKLIEKGYTDSNGSITKGDQIIRLSENMPAWRSNELSWSFAPHLETQKWEIGLRINPDENGIRTKEEIKTKIEMLFSNNNLKKNALTMKEMTMKSVSEGGSSYKNFEKFIDHLREG